MFSVFSREDELPAPELAVPVGVPNQCATMGMCLAATAKEQFIGDLIIIALYYLL